VKKGHDEHFAPDLFSQARKEKNNRTHSQRNMYTIFPPHNEGERAILHIGFLSFWKETHAGAHTQRKARRCNKEKNVNHPKKN
jgi:hypothetical protein